MGAGRGAAGSPQVPRPEPSAGAKVAGGIRPRSLPPRSARALSPPPAPALPPPPRPRRRRRRPAGDMQSLISPVTKAILVALFIFAILLILYVILWYICRDVDCDHGI